MEFIGVFILMSLLYKVIGFPNGHLLRNACGSHTYLIRPPHLTTEIDLFQSCSSGRSVHSSRADYEQIQQLLGAPRHQVTIDDIMRIKVKALDITRRITNRFTDYRSFLDSCSRACGVEFPVLVETMNPEADRNTMYSNLHANLLKFGFEVQLLQSETFMLRRHDTNMFAEDLAVLENRITNALCTLEHILGERHLEVDPALRSFAYRQPNNKIATDVCRYTKLTQLVLFLNHFEEVLPFLNENIS